MPRIYLTSDGDMQRDRITNVGAGANPTDAVNKGQLDAKSDVAERVKAGGVARLDGTGRVPFSQVQARLDPMIILSDTDQGIWIDLNSTSEQMLKVPHVRGAMPGEREVFFEPIADPGAPSGYGLSGLRQIPDGAVERHRGGLRHQTAHGIRHGRSPGTASYLMAVG